MPESIEDTTSDTAITGTALLDDEQIVNRVLEGDLPTFELIMRRYNQRLFRVVRSILGDDDETEDVLQETYVRAFEHLDQFAGRAKFSTWLTKIAVHEALARRKRAERTRATDFADPENACMVPLSKTPDGEQKASTKELGSLLTKAVDELPVDLRMVFALRIIEGLDTSEAANCLELTEANVKVRLHRARAMLRERIDARIGSEARELYEFGGARCDRIVQNVLTRLAHART